MMKKYLYGIYKIALNPPGHLPLPETECSPRQGCPSAGHAPHRYTVLREHDDCMYILQKFRLGVKMLHYFKQQFIIYIK